MKKHAFLSYLFILALLIHLFPIVPAYSQDTGEEEECEKKSLTVIIRDGNGDFVPGINFEVYNQGEDVDGLPKPGNKIKSGSISPILGNGLVEFDDEGGYYYAVKVYDKSLDNVDYWFYDDVSLGCGESDEVTFRISSMNISLWNTDEEPYKNYDFNLYTQRYDIEGDPIHEKDDFIGDFNTSAEGEVTIYIPSGGEAIDGDGADYHVLEFAGPDGGTFTIYDNYIRSGQVTDLEYTLSDIRMVFKDDSGVYFPANTKVEFFEQTDDTRDQSALGKKIKDLYTNDSGEIIFIYPAGEYAARVMNADKEYEYFWDLEIREEEREEYYLQTGADWSASSGECDATSNLNLVIRDLDGNYLSGLNYALYQQALDADNLPIAKTKILSGVVDSDGRATEQFNPDPRETYALQIWDLNENLGDFWFFNEFKIQCDEDVEINKQIPSLSIILRDGNSDLIKNQAVSLYTQKHDVDGRPIKEKQDLVSSKLSTSEEGEVRVYIAPNHPYSDSKKGTYVMETKGRLKDYYYEYDIDVSPQSNKTVEYNFSDIVFTIKEANGVEKQDFKFTVYKQKSGIKGGLELDDKISSLTTDSSASARLEYPAGKISLVLDDDIGQDYTIWNYQINNKQRTYQEVLLNSTRVVGLSPDGSVLPVKSKIDIYSMKKVSEGKFIRDKKIKSLTTDSSGAINLSLSPNPYLFMFVYDKQEYGQAAYIELGKEQTVTIQAMSKYAINDTTQFSLAVPESSAQSGGNGALANKLKGYILLQVQQNGEAWYVHPDEGKRYYMKDGATAYEMMRRFGLGVTSSDLSKIPVGINKRFEEFDYDGDYVHDKMEEALGTDMYDHDTDNDGYSDGEEVENGYNPNGSGKMELDLGLADKLRGRILLQVESRGEAWYVNPEDNRRYYMKDGESAYEIMRFLSLGITDENLASIASSDLD